MRDAIHEILTDVSDSFSNMIDMALANEIQVGTICHFVLYRQITLGLDVLTSDL